MNSPRSLRTMVPPSAAVGAASTRLGPSGSWPVGFEPLARDEGGSRRRPGAAPGAPAESLYESVSAAASSRPRLYRRMSRSTAAWPFGGERGWPWPACSHFAIDPALVAAPVTDPPSSAPVLGREALQNSWHGLTTRPLPPPRVSHRHSVRDEV